MLPRLIPFGYVSARARRRAARSFSLTLAIGGAQRQYLRMPTPSPRVQIPEIRIGGYSIVCDSDEERQLLLDANRIADDESAAMYFSIGRLMLIKDACQLHSLGKLQRLVKQAIDRRNAGGAR